MSAVKRSSNIKKTNAFTDYLAWSSKNHTDKMSIAELFNYINLNFESLTLEQQATRRLILEWSGREEEYAEYYATVVSSE